MADQMIDTAWNPHSTFSNFEYYDGNGNPVYSANYVAGTTYYGIAYGQHNPQNNWSEFYANVSSTSSGNQTYGNDCSGFVSICWKLPARYTTSSFESGIGTYWSSLGAIGSVQSVNLLLGDALNSSYDTHIVMFLSYNSTGINTMEQTIAGPNHLAKRWTRSYTYLVNQQYRPIRRNQIVESSAKAEMTSPANGSTFNSSSATFAWNSGSGVSDYFLYVGNSVGANDIYGVDQGTALSRTVSGIPTDGRAIYVRLWSYLGGGWQCNDYTYTAYSGTSSAKAQMTSPANGSTLSSSSVGFTWSAGSGVSDYFLYVGNSAGANDIYGADQGTALSRTVSGIPTDGRAIYVRLWSYLGGGWQCNDYTYTAFTTGDAVDPHQVTFNRYTAGGSVSSWISAGCVAAGVPANSAWITGYETAIGRESSGDANACNIWDANAITPPGFSEVADWGNAWPASGSIYLLNGALTPFLCSRGVAQCTPRTFATYHALGTSLNIYDPTANIAASINYVRDRYGVSADGSDLASKVQQFDPSRDPKGYIVAR